MLRQIYTASAPRTPRPPPQLSRLLPKKHAPPTRTSTSPHPHQPDSHTLNKSFPKKILRKGVQLYFEISLLSFIHKIFEQNPYPYTTVYLVRTRNHKNADEKAHTPPRRSKNAKKRTKTHKKRANPPLF